MSDTLESYLSAGGIILVLLSGLGIIMFASAVLRAFCLRRGYRGAVHEAWVQPVDGAGVVPEAIQLLASEGLGTPVGRLRFHRLVGQLRSFRRTLRLASQTAPVLGLLGTVRGMGQTFAALGADSDSARIADGIAEALVTTEVGLALALPGLVLATWLDRKEQRVRQELEWLASATPERERGAR